jgi:tetrahydromethanopterin S-methyltransferase subunit A
MRSRRFCWLFICISGEIRAHIKECRDSNRSILNETPVIIIMQKQHFQDLLGSSELEVS